MRLSWTLGGYALARLAVLIGGMEISRKLGIPAFANLSYFIFSMNLLGSLSDMGISNAVLRYGVEAQSAGGKSQGLRRVVACVQLATLVWCAALTGLCLLTPVGSWRAVDVAVLGVAALLLTWQATFNSVMQALNQLRDQFIGNILFSSAIIATTLIAVARGDVDLAKIGFVVAYLLQFVWSWRAIRHAFDGSSTNWGQVSRVDVRAVLQTVSVMAITSGLASLMPWYVSDRIGLMPDGAIGVAVFAASMSIFGLIMAIPGRIGLLIYIHQLQQQRAIVADAGRRILSAVTADAKAIGLAVAFLLVLILALQLMSGPILGRYGPVIAEYRAPIMGFMLIGFAASVLSIIGNRIVATGNLVIWLGVTILQCLGAVLALNVASVPASWAGTVSYAGGFCVAMIVALPSYIYSIKRPKI